MRPIAGRATGRNDFRQLELVHNGRVIHSVAAQANDDHFSADLQFKLPASESGWIALRIPQNAGQNEFDKPLFAHTSPIYLTVNNQRIFRADVARGLLAEMKASQEFVNEKGTFANATEREAVLRVYRDAIDSWQQQIEARQ